MHWRPLLPLLAVTAVLSIQVRDRSVHRLVGGHLRIFHEDPHDTDLLITSASGSKEKRGQKSEGGGDDEKKTLSQQVADGKYGLIQKELFTKPIKRPGVLSYEPNPEVPKDTIGNLGGLSKNDIWLAENHLLVLKGGTYPPPEDLHQQHHYHQQQTWPAIDDYKAPSRQVKIPANPKVPPPFPVQLTDDGPLQILGTNSTRTLNGTFDAQGGYAVPPPEGFDPFGPYPPPPPPYPYPPDAPSGKAAFPVPPGSAGPGGWSVGAPLPPSLNGTLPPFFASLPPGAAILPPPGNETFDEDDPSIYYPPPYSFYYPKDNTSAVSAGPLVPGIILPPPPDFFGPLEETTKPPEEVTTMKKTRGRVTTTTVLPQIHPTTSPLPPTLENRPIKIYPVHINNELKPFTTPIPKVITILPVRTKTNRTTVGPFVRKHKPSVTILKPVKTTTTRIKPYTGEPYTTPPVYFNEVSSLPKKSRGEKTIISTTQIPLKIYYSTSNEIETHSQTPEKSRKTTKSPAQYYYYEEEPKYEQPKPRYEQPKPKPYRQQPPPKSFEEKPYYKEASSTQSKPYYYEEERKPQFVYVTSRPYTRQTTPSRSPYRFVQNPSKDSFSVHIARLQKQIHEYYTTPRPSKSKPVYQFSFEASNYKDQEKFRPLPRYSVQIQPAIEIIPTESPIRESNHEYSGSTSGYVPQGQAYTRGNSQYSGSPQIEYQQTYQSTTERPLVPSYRSTSRPITQYSFEATANPIYQGYYTKPDEGYFDENTKKYFTTFGKKLTTPMPPKKNPQSQGYQQQRGAYQQQTQQQQQGAYQQQQQGAYQQQQGGYQQPSLEGDTNVNYLHPRPTVNPDAEYVNPRYPQVVKYTPRAPPAPPRYVQKPKEGPEIIKAVPVPVNVPTAEGQAGSFISYQLPGDDGAHFYFLTPQLAQRRDQGAGYYYSSQRIRRDNQRGGKDR